MIITSFQFLGFVVITLIVYHLFPVNKRWWVLLAASVFFYISFSFSGIFVLTGSALLTFFSGLRVQKYKDELSLWLKENKGTADKETRKEKKAYYEKKQRVYVVASVIIIIFILFLCKYYGFLAVHINNSFNTGLWTAENVLLPLGISYYSLQLIGYLVDVNRDIISAEKNPLKVILYGAFFLSIMQGPFNRYDNLMPQICADNRKQRSYQDIKSAILRIVCGYIKKLCIADQIGIIANEVFANYNDYEGLGLLFGIICFAIQLYADFSGYMDIIIGIGQLFGIEMPENFKQPFFSRTMSEFWKRWHITLGMWLQDYVFYPLLKSDLFRKMNKILTNTLGKEAGRRIPTYIGMFILWVLIGAWHGVGFNYVFGVGILQFLYIFVEEEFASAFKKAKKIMHINDKKLSWHIVQSLKCTVLMMFAWIFFRSETFIDAIKLFLRLFIVPKPRQITRIFYSGQVVGEPMNWLTFIGIAVILLLILDFIHENGRSVCHIIGTKKYPIQLAFYLFLVFTIIIFGAYGNQYDAQNFIYFEF